MTEQQPMGTASMPNTAQPAPRPAALTTEEHAAEVERLNKQLYDKRKASDPLLYDRVIAFHPHAGGSDEGFKAFSADYDRMAKEAEEAQAKATAAAAQPTPPTPPTSG